MRGQLFYESEMIFMPRHARCYYDTSFFHVIVQGIKKEYIFKNEKYIQEYLRLMEQYEKDCEVEVLAYCIMNNHAHLLMYTSSSKDMAVFMKKVNTSYAMFYNRCEDGRVGYVFRDRYLSEPIKDEGYFIKCINYIHNNPVKAGMVEWPSEYAYSSYKDFIEGDRIQKVYELSSIKIDKELLKGNHFVSVFLDIEQEKDVFELVKEIADEDIDSIKMNKEKLKRVVKILKNEYKVSYKMMREQMKISRKQMVSLKN